MNALGAYYTKDLFSELLVSNLENTNPNYILELGVGRGALLKAAYNRWKDANYVAADINISSIDRINKEMPFIKTFHANSLRLNIEQEMSLDKSSIDIAVCNPPYLRIKEKEPFYSLFEEAKLIEFKSLYNLTSDIIFLAQNIKMLKNNGELGIILPDNILTGKEFSLVRKSILSNHKLRSVIELPERIFTNTEAKTHILLIEKGGKTADKINLYKAGKDGVCNDSIEISTNQLENRMDFSFHQGTQSFKFKKATKKIKDFEIEVLRGKLSNAELKPGNIPYLHSTSFTDGALLSLKKLKKEEKVTHAIANTGDIVIVRVGRGCVGKSARIIKGSALVSDCLFIIKGNDLELSKIWKFIQSEKGKAWLKAYSHGVCSKVISKIDIYELPVID